MQFFEKCLSKAFFSWKNQLDLATSEHNLLSEYPTDVISNNNKAEKRTGTKKSILERLVRFICLVIDVLAVTSTCNRKILEIFAT